MRDFILNINKKIEKLKQMEAQDYGNSNNY